MSSMNPQDVQTMSDAGGASCEKNVNGCGARDTRNERREGASGKLYWRSLEDLQDTPEFNEFVEREFPTSASEILTNEDRRGFLRVMAASLALAGLGLTGCRRWPDERIAPYAHRPAGRMPGVSVYFATSIELMGLSQSLLVRTYDGRPLKIEGNAENPWSPNSTATDAWTQASILDLYDPDRSRSIKHTNETATFASFKKWAGDWLTEAKKNGGEGVVILSEATTSPTVQRLRNKMKAMLPNADWQEFEAMPNDGWFNASLSAFGAAYRPTYALDDAKVVVSLESDYLMDPVTGVRNTRGHAKSRRVDENKISRLYAFESGASVTGANADERVALRSADVAVIAARLAAKIAPNLAGDLQGLAGVKIETSRDDATLNKIVDAAAADLMNNRGAGLVTAGWNQPSEVHLLAMVMNEALGNENKTVMYHAAPEAKSQSGCIKSLSDAIRTGTVNTVVVIGGNPAFTAPSDLKFGDALKTVTNTVHVGEYENETSELCKWHINRAHQLESWGDGRLPDGTHCLRQPLIEPFFEGKTEAEILSLMLGEDMDSHDLTRKTFDESVNGKNSDDDWRTALHDGFVTQSAPKTESVSVRMNALPAAISAFTAQFASAKAGDLEVVYAKSYQLLDGRFANNGWLQEKPDPMTKLTWDNAAVMNPETAKAKGFKTGDIVKLTTPGGSAELPVLIQPGQWKGTVSVAMGYGRTKCGRVAKDAGVNVYPLRTFATMGSATGATVAATGRRMTLGLTQDHHAIDSVGGKGAQQRLPSLYREADLTEFKEHPRFVQHRTEVAHRLSLFAEDHEFQSESGREGSRFAWGMTIDLNACTGCGACIMACQAENNIPIVGKDQVVRGREMHWLRVDRYFKAGTESQPEAYALMPVMCMHCENAPCEQVCPVAATVHDKDGLNVMVYNRCVGTRYCSNNCPYKVRKFNYFDFHRRGPLREQPGMLLQVEPDYYRLGQAKADPMRQMQFNPDVTVRMRGIMEKCTYCIQRIETAKIAAKNAWVKADPATRSKRAGFVPDGTIKTACQQACPAEAIVFGDYNDSQSQISKTVASNPRSYEMLEEINTKPRTRYLAKIRNPSVSMSSTAGLGEEEHGHREPAGATMEGGHG
ncbi:MAG TPA: TAT-variant-translocated molybdopterin oxidoreductase [Phycisphaerales bacterium]|nr:TAT-variant-translocated molybdopterin oxidoreductase [Phycisphaerales bacterium]